MMSIQGEKKKKKKKNDFKKQGIIKHLKLIMEILKRVVGDLQPYLTSKKTLEMTKFAVLNHLNL